MSAPPPSNNKKHEDFYVKALSSLTQQIAQQTSVSAAPVPPPSMESFAQSLVENDSSKIDSAVKSYLSLVAARSSSASDTDASGILHPGDGRLRCAFSPSQKSASHLDVNFANRCALTCARVLLSTINTTIIPEAPSTYSQSAMSLLSSGLASTAPLESISELESNIVQLEKIKKQKEAKYPDKLQNDAIRILWNGLANDNLMNSKKEKGQKVVKKPSKFLGRKSLLFGYPFILERFRRGLPVLENDSTSTGTAVKSASTSAPSDTSDNPLQSLSDDLLPSVPPPKDIEIEQWKAFYTEFGLLLAQACINDSGIERTLDEDDSALLWSSDGGVGELQRRRDQRAKRAAEALKVSSEGFEVIEESVHE